ncbi:MAG: SpoIIE family protein phosphatase [Cytophagales bacterium]|nr:SpoIIE family protein phosphatase [Cytophagales bacterium]MDW8385140.1 two-component regulator propeller domain-containing protein [Flammeovirgaceae bacterium]
MMCSFKNIGFLWGMLCCFSLQAQREFYFEHISTEQGLPHPSVYSFLQDKYGFIWVATQNGIARYDGYHFTVYTHNPLDSTSLPDTWAKVTLEDQQGILWIGTANGLARQRVEDGYTEKFVVYRHHAQDPHSLINNNIWSLFEDHQGNIWIGTDSGMSCMTLKNRATGRFINFKHNEDDPTSIPKKGVNAICQDADKNLWIGTWGSGIAKFDMKTKTFKRYTTTTDTLRKENNLSNDYVKRMYFHGGLLYIITNGGGISIFNPKTETFSHIKKQADKPYSLSSNHLLSALHDSQNRFWVGTYDAGLCLQITDTSFQHFRYDPLRPNTIKDNWIASLFEDKSNVLWIGHANGINKTDLRPLKFRAVKHDPTTINTIPDKKINFVYEDKFGEIWFGLWHGGLVRWDRKLNLFFQYTYNGDESSISDNRVWAIVEDQYDNIWVGTGRGLNKFNRKSETWKHYIRGENAKGLSYNNISCMLKDSDSTIWIGTWSGGINLFNINTEEFISFRHDAKNPYSLPHEYITSIIHDEGNVYWLSTSGGGLVQMIRLRYDSVIFKQFEHNPLDKTSISHNTVSQVFKDSKGRIWVCTVGGGLNLFDKNTQTFRHFFKEDGLPDNAIESMIEDNKQSLWLFTHKGISKFNPNTLEFRNFDLKDGLTGYLFQGYPCKTRNHEIIVGGEKGFNIFIPDSIKESQFQPPVYIVNFKVNNESLRPSSQGVLKRPVYQTEKIELSAHENFFSLEFAALDYTYPAKIKYAYKLDGFDKDWIYTTADKRFANYTNVSPGEYVFMVKATNSDGIWSPKMAKLTIIITPPFWQTWWFRILMLLVVSSAIYVGYKDRIRRIETQKAILERLVAERTAEISAKNAALEEKNAKIQAQKYDIESSILYAKRIQEAMLPLQKEIREALPNSFIMYRPRDVVSGDFYWFAQRYGKIYLAVGDCTGHGVPGAFMSLIGSSLLSKIVFERNVLNADKILELLDEEIRHSLKQTENENSDSIDVGIVVIDEDIIEFAGAKRPLIYIQNGQVYFVKGTNRSCGGVKYHQVQPFEKHIIVRESPTYCYLFSDGYEDQFGGEKGKKFMSKRFKELIANIYQRPFDEQFRRLTHEFVHWKGEYDQVDDVLVVGFMVSEM